MLPNPEILRQRSAFAGDCWRLGVSSSRSLETTKHPFGSHESAHLSPKLGGRCASTLIFIQIAKTAAP